MNNEQGEGGRIGRKIIMRAWLQWDNTGPPSGGQPTPSFRGGPLGGTWLAAKEPYVSGGKEKFKVISHEKGQRRTFLLDASAKARLRSKKGCRP